MHVRSSMHQAGYLKAHMQLSCGCCKNHCHDINLSRSMTGWKIQGVCVCELYPMLLVFLVASHEFAACILQLHQATGEDIVCCRGGKWCCMILTLWKHVLKRTCYHCLESPQEKGYHSFSSTSFDVQPTCRLCRPGGEGAGPPAGLGAGGDTQGTVAVHPHLPVCHRRAAQAAAGAPGRDPGHRAAEAGQLPLQVNKPLFIRGLLWAINLTPPPDCCPTAQA